MTLNERWGTSGVLPGGGEMGALARSIDWSRTPVGPVEAWPQSLRTAISILFESKFPMLVGWGPEFVQFYNDPFRPILGDSKHPAMGRSTRDTFAEAWHIIGPLFEQVMQGTAVGFDDMLVPLNRYGFLEECYFVYSYSPIRDESGGVAGVFVTCTETTARVIAERRLRTLRELASEAAHAQQEEQAWRGAAQVLNANPVDVPFALLYGLDAGGLEATLAAATVDTGAAPLVRAGDAGAWPLFDAAATGAPLVVRDVQRRFGAHPGPVWPEPIDTAIVQPITRPGLPQPYGFLVAGVSPRLPLDANYRDFLALVGDQMATAVANARTYEEERRRTEALLELDRQKTAFFSTVSHEFRTPLTLMLAPVEAALARSPAMLEAADLELVYRNATRLLRLVNTLLDFSRIEAGRATSTFEDTDVAALTRDLASTFQSLMDQAGLAFEIDCPPLSPVSVDRGMWEKIVLNLLSNAFKFTLAGGVRVQLREFPECIQLSVQDTGAGIPVTDVPRIFDRFHRVSATPSRTFEGSGIGLALVRELVLIHGGDVQVESVEGRGSTFIVSIPLRSGQAADGVPAEMPATSAIPYVEEARRWVGVPAKRHEPPDASAARAFDRDATVLVADDNADMRDYLARLLGGFWRVELATNGLEALQLMAASRPDLVLTDVMMPELDGVELLREIRRNADTRLMPVIVLSARSGEESRIEGLAAGADDYVVKPFSARELIARVRTHLDLARARRAIEDARRAAEAANRAKDEFLAMLGHELRNPLAPILTALQLMTLRGDRGAEKERAIIERQVRYVVRLVDDLLDVSRIARGKIELKRERIELAAVVVKAVEMTSPVIEQKRHDLDIDVASVGLAVDADPTRLQQVVFNLLHNAAKYTEPQGRISLTAALHGETIELRVRDTGVGIEAEKLPHVFDLFFQDRQALDRAQAGLGLGLAIVRNLVELHGGRVSASSGGPGRGSEFVVTLPASPQQLVHRSPDETAERARPFASHHTRVLIVDDNEEAAALLAAALALAGFDARTAADAAQALQIADSFTPDVGVLDLGLPFMDGYELAARLQMKGRPATLVAVTGYGTRADQQRTKESGFDLHLVKPIDVNDLIGFLRHVDARSATE